MPIGTSDGQYFENVYDQYTQSKRDEVTSKQPLGSPEKPADALKSAEGTQTPENTLEANFLEKLTGFKDPAAEWRRGRDEAAKDTRSIAEKVTDPSLLNQAVDIAMSAGMGTMAGVRSKLIDKNALAEAQIMKADGAHPDDVFYKTGMFQGVDGRWRYEINDSKAKFNEGWVDRPPVQEKVSNDPFEQIPFEPNKGKVVAKLPEVLDHPELYKAYPDLKKVDVVHDPEMSGAVFKKDENAMVIGSDSNTKEVVLHELQHWIQNHEGFAKGGSPALAGQDYALKFTPHVQDLADRAEYLLGIKNSGGRITAKEQAELEWMHPVFLKYAEYTKAANERAFELYQRLAGEVESRNVETRAMLDPETSRYITPWRTADEAPQRQVVVDQPAWATVYGTKDPLGRIHPVK